MEEGEGRGESACQCYCPTRPAGSTREKLELGEGKQVATPPPLRRVPGPACPTLRSGGPEEEAYLPLGSLGATDHWGWIFVLVPCASEERRPIQAPL